MTLADNPPNAEMEPWPVVHVNGEPSLFGFAEQHPKTGELSWTLSTEFVEIDEPKRCARTASGRGHTLGRRIECDGLDEEGWLLWWLLLSSRTEMIPPSFRDICWLTARKTSTQMGAEAPLRDATAVLKFLAMYNELYLIRHAGSRPN